jgi:hypothetical protein
MHTGEDAPNACCLQPEHALEQPPEHRAVVGQNWVVAVLEKIGLIDLDLFANDAAAIDAAAHHPSAMAMIGAAVAVLAEGAAEFGNHDHNGVAPSRRTDLFGKTCQRAAEFAEAVG